MHRTIERHVDITRQQNDGKRSRFAIVHFSYSHLLQRNCIRIEVILYQSGNNFAFILVYFDRRRLRIPTLGRLLLSVEAIAAVGCVTSKLLQLVSRRFVLFSILHR